MYPAKAHLRHRVAWVTRECWMIETTSGEFSLTGNDVLGGGLLRGHVSLLEGDPGTGKTTIALRFLLEGRVAREGSISRGTFNKAWNRGVQELLGLRGLTPHVMRHVGATIYLARRPGEYAGAASLLGASERATENFYAGGKGKEAAELFAEVLAEIDPLLDLDGSSLLEGKR
jgi:hypothetical protein